MEQKEKDSRKKGRNLEQQRRKDRNDGTEREGIMEKMEEFETAKERGEE